MSATAASFYIIGGTVRQGAPCYVERQADEDLYEGLLQGEFCSVLHARQMGKSSLMVHTAARLRDEGVAVVILDLTGIGQNLSVEQWYGGLLRRIGQQLDPSGDLEEELEAFWFAQEARVGPLERWMTALRQVVLPRIGVQAFRGSGVQEEATSEPERPNARTPERPNARTPERPPRLVIFVDEIDAVRSLPFSTDEFFAGIRECYNRRAQEPAFERLTFCLLGAASPSDLIQDTRTTPFNIGLRIELTDFTAAEAAPLAAGLGVQAFRRSGGQEQPMPGPERLKTRTPERLLRRILHWTGGHPYLTQRLCQAVAQDPNPKSKRPEGTRNPKSTVDRHCEELFLSKAARAKDVNLLFVRERLLKSEVDPASLLDLYKKVRAGQRVAVEDTNRLVDLLRLSGVARAQGGRLAVRNRIYQRVFDGEWITQHMPDAELRRQQSAYRRGLLRATSVAAAVLAVIATLSLVAVHQARRAQQRELTAQQNLYAADMNLAQQAWEAGNVERMRHLLEAHWPAPGQPDLRGFEWRYLWRLSERGDALSTLRGHTAAVGPVAFSPDGKLLATGSDDKTVRLWDVAARRQVAVLESHQGEILSLAFSRDGKRLMTGSYNSTVEMWDIVSRRVVSTLQGRSSWGNPQAFSPDGKTMATAAAGYGVELWDLTAHRRLASLPGHKGDVHALAFSPDGKFLATGSFDTTVKLWDVAARRELPSHLRHKTALLSLAFSPSGRILASGSWGGVVKLWDIAAQKELAALPAHKGEVHLVAFSPDGRLLVSGGADTTLKLWNVASRQEIATFKGHTGAVGGMAFSPDGKTLATGSEDKTVKLWSLAPGRRPGVLQESPSGGFSGLAFSPDSRLLAAGGRDGVVRLWDVATEREIATLTGDGQRVSCVAFSPDGKLLATGSGVWNDSALPGELKLWDVATRREIAHLKQQHALFSLAFSPDGQTLASAGGDGSVTLRDRVSRRVMAVLPSRGAWGWNSVVAFSANGQILASSITESDTVQLWDVRSLRSPPGTPRSEGEARRWPSGTLTGHTNGVNALAFSPDGRTLATGGGDLVVPGHGGYRTAKLWDVARRREIASLEGIEGQVMSVAFSPPDGRTLALGHQDGVVKLWDVATQREVLTLAGQTDVVAEVAFAPDGNTLASLSNDGTVRLWRAVPAAEIKPMAAVPRP